MNPFRKLFRGPPTTAVSFEEFLHAQGGVIYSRILQLASAGSFAVLLSLLTRAYMLGWDNNTDAWMCVPTFFSIMFYNAAKSRYKVNSQMLNNYWKQLNKGEQSGE